MSLWPAFGNPWFRTTNLYFVTKNTKDYSIDLKVKLLARNKDLSKTYRILRDTQNDHKVLEYADVDDAGLVSKQGSCGFLCYDWIPHSNNAVFASGYEEFEGSVQMEASHALSKGKNIIN